MVLRSDFFCCYHQTTSSSTDGLGQVVCRPGAMVGRKWGTVIMWDHSAYMVWTLLMCGVRYVRCQRCRGLCWCLEYSMYGGHEKPGLCWHTKCTIPVKPSKILFKKHSGIGNTIMLCYTVFFVWCAEGILLLSLYFVVHWRALSRKLSRWEMEKKQMGILLRGRNSKPWLSHGINGRWELIL